MTTNPATPKTKRAPRFELVRTPDGYHGRYRAPNGAIVWNTEVYNRPRPVHRAIAALGLDLETRLVDERSRTEQAAR